MRRLLAVLIWSLSFSAGAEADPSVSRPSSAGMSAERLSRMSEVMQGFIDEGHLAGTVTLVARKGRVVQFEALGQRWVERGLPMEKDTIFRIASMTKPIVSVGLMMLYEEGKFLLDDPIEHWIPEVKNKQVWRWKGDPESGPVDLFTEPQKRPVTVRHILTHMSGLDSKNGLPEEARRTTPRSADSRTVSDEIRATADEPLAFQPGEDWQYGGSTNYVGLLIERISGQTLEDFLQERLLQPLEMKDTSFLVPEDKVDRLSALYRPDADKQLQLMEAPKAGALLQMPETFFLGAGGMFSTARDYYRFSQMLANGGVLDGVRILGRRTVELMMSNHSGSNDIWVRGPGYGFGLGFSVLTDHSVAEEPLSPGTFGWGGAFGTWFWIDPSEDMIGIVMTQLQNHRHVHHRMMLSVIANQAILDQPPAPTIRTYRTLEGGDRAIEIDRTLRF